MCLARLRQHRLIAPDTLYPGKGRGVEGVAIFPDGPPADFATGPAGRQETEDATSPITRVCEEDPMPAAYAHITLVNPMASKCGWMSRNCCDFARSMSTAGGHNAFLHLC